MKKYRSKIGIGIVLFIAIVIGITSAILIINQAWPGLLINIVVIAFIIYVFTSTYYIINGNDLIVKSGFLVHITVKIDRIRKIEETRNPISSPAASLDRIGIFYNKSDYVIISPEDKMDFIDQLKMINKEIEVILKKDRLNN
jgi:hypothetical protein